VTTVVAKLFCLVGRSVAVFGRKDYQQWRVIARMARDLGMPIEVVGRPTIREHDGLALSSRNRYLDAEARARALGLSRGLRDAWDAWKAGERDADRLSAIASAPVDTSFDRIDYVAIVDPDSLAPLRGSVGSAAILCAAHLGTTRLIDNVVLAHDDRP
jgi:pantoate--beta-alanine ligase